MKTTIKHLSDTKVQLTIALTTDELADAEQVALSKLAKDMKISGFRKGKVPIAVAAKHIDPNALQEKTLDDAISKAVAQAFLTEKIQVLDRPSVEVQKYVPGATLEFTAEAEILPEVVLGDYKKLKVTQEKVTVSAKEVNEIIDRMRQGVAEKIIDFIGKKGDVPFEGGTGTDYALTLGSKSFIPGFEEGIIGKKAGETFDLELTFPDDYHAADLKGTKVTFTTTLKTVKESVLPEVDDVFAAKSGPFTSADEMKDDIKTKLAEQKEGEVREKLKDDLVKQLIAISKVPTPEILIADQAKSIEQDFERNLTYQGLSLDQYLVTQKFKDKDEWLEKEVKPTAVKRVQAGLALAELSKVEKIDATNEELEAHIDLYRAQYAKNAEVLKQFDDPEVRRDIANRLLTEKTVDRLVELNK
jgi:trigger factor